MVQVPLRCDAWHPSLLGDLQLVNSRARGQEGTEMADPGMLLAFSNPTDFALVDEYNRWYNQTHARDALQLPGAVRARRWRRSDVQLVPAHAEGRIQRFLAGYDLADI